MKALTLSLTLSRTRTLTRYFFGQLLVTVWSAPNYCYRCGNVAAILTINADGVINFSVFEPRPQNLRKVPDFSTRMPDYFL